MIWPARGSARAKDDRQRYATVLSIKQVAIGAAKNVLI